LIHRSILAKGIYALWATGSSYAELHEALRARAPELAPPCMGRSFKFTIESFQRRRSGREQRELIEGFKYLGFDGKVAMKNAELEFVVFEEFEFNDNNNNNNQKEGEGGKLLRVAFALKIADSARDVVGKYDLKKRAYIGTTSMDAELSLVTANMAHAAPGRLVFDPFVGTGSFLYCAAHFGAVTMGSDIDGRQVRGKKPGKNVKGNFGQYGLLGNYLDCFTSDLTNTPLRKTRFLDAVICDPPYGVREGLKVLGSRDPEAAKEPVLVDGVPGHLRPDYIPPKRPYGFLAMLDDILQFSADHLVDGGRLTFWMPTANDEEGEDGALDIPAHPLLELRAVCVQDFNKCAPPTPSLYCSRGLRC
jgi:tRNA (guanine10-N2)-methyltransferase